VTLLHEGKAVSPDGRVVVYVRTVPQELWKPTAAPAVKVFQEKISPDDFKFSDSMRVVVIGDAIDFVNKAQDNHNVFSATTMTFEMPESTAYSTGTHRFTQQGTYHVQCDIHESMRLDVLAVKNPFFAPADAQGHYTMRPLPPGEYKLVAWERNGGEVELPVSCPSDKPVDFELKEASAPPHRHKDKRPWRGHGGGPW
jgi:plastocyanin